MSLRDKISIKALVLGFITDSCGSLVGSLALGAVWAIVFLNQGGTLEALTSHFNSSAFYCISFILGLALTVLGGYVAGRVAGKYEVHHAAIVGFLSTLYGLLFAPFVPLWLTILSVITVLPSAALGGWIAQRQRG